jgi:hypothetical protein
VTSTANTPAGNDDVVKVIYQAVADYSQLLRETRKAREETKALKADIEGLGATTTATVKVTADTGAAKLELARVLKDVLVKVKVTVDAAAAQTEITRVTRNVVVKAAIAVDAARANADIQRALRGLRATVQVSADTDRFKAQLVQVTRATSVKIGVELDRAAAVTKMRALITYLQQMGPVKLKVEVDSSVVRDLDKAVGDLRRLRDSLRVPGGGGGPPTPAPGPRPTPSASPGGAKQDPIPEGLAGAAGLVLKIVPALAAAVPVAAALAVGVGTVAAGLLAAGAAAGIFAVAAVGGIAKVTAAVQAYEKSGTISSGPLGQVVAEFEQLKKSYSELEKSTEKPVFAVFSTGLQIASNLLAKVSPLVTTMAGAVNGALGQVKRSIAGAGFDQFLGFVDRQGPRAIAGFTTGLLGLAGGAGRLVQAFEPFISDFIDGFARMGTAFDRWAAGLGSNQQFQDFLTYAQAQVPKVIDLVTDLIGAGENLVTALAPVGSVLLSLAGGALAFIAALPPGVLRTVVLAVLAVAAAIKVLSLAFAIQEGIVKFRALMAALPAVFSSVTGAALGSAAAVAAATAVIAAGVLIINGLLGELAKQQDEAADAAKRHQSALTDLGKTIAENPGGTDSTAVKTQQLGLLQNISGDGQAGGVFGYGTTKATVSLQDVQKATGLSDKDLVTGSLGDAKQQSVNIGKMEAYREKLLADAKQPGADTKGLKAQADAVEKVITAYEGASLAAGEGADAAKQYADATGQSGTAATKAAAAYTSQADAAKAVKTALKADFSSDASVTAATTAITALDAYNAQLQTYRDAETQATAAAVTAKRATQDLAQARQDAAQRVVDYQRSLRDLTISEKQAKLSAKEADEALTKAYANGDADQIAQAQIDDQNAHNTLNDLEQDKGGKKTTLKKQIAAGVTGDRQLQDAITANNNAQTALTTANRNLGTAADKLADLHLAFATAAGAVGLTEGQIKTLKTNMDKIKTKTVKIEVDTKDADKKLATILQGQYAIQLLAKNPDWSYQKALAEAQKMIPTVGATATAAAAPKPGDSTFIGPVASRADGGPVIGAGTATSDSVHTILPVGGPANLSNGEHIVTDAEVRAGGGHGYLQAFRAALRAGQRWGPTLAAGIGAYAAGGAARPGWAMPPVRFAGPPATAVPGYAAGGAVRAAAAAGMSVDRSVTITVNGGIHNAVPETASTSLYKQVRRAVEGDYR